MPQTRIAAIIPARMGSSRLPGKPLLDIHGLPMVEHVRRRALRCRRFTEVVVATCDEAIMRVVERYGGRCVMTSPRHPAATDRVAEAMRELACTHVVNVQGDELLVLPRDLDRMVEAMEAEPDIPAWNAVTRMTQAEELADSSIVKGVVSTSGRIMLCARDFSWLTDRVGPPWEPIRKIVGILGYRRDFLARYAQWVRTPLEAAEQIDQSRILEHDVILRAVEFAKSYPGVNEPREVELAVRCLDEDPAQHEAFQAIQETAG
ncbi:MAG: 3-deoxy-manno-octulosonate cytidylyltransferase [Candidatus Omnitrophica bacterium]|nr:3-deoxy-manno-octulosonate cytidylyltransferase [Candidatus Omnitrophota bacterium]